MVYTRSWCASTSAGNAESRSRESRAASAASVSIDRFNTVAGRSVAAVVPASNGRAVGPLLGDGDGALHARVNRAVERVCAGDREHEAGLAAAARDVPGHLARAVVEPDAMRRRVRVRP